MTREGRLQLLLEDLELAAANLLRNPKNGGAQAQVNATLQRVRAFRRADAAAAELALADAAADRIYEPVPARVQESPVAIAERTGRAGYKDDA